MDMLNVSVPDFSGSPIKFLKEVREELKKVTWPSRKEVIKMTTVVIMVSALVSILISSLDYVFTNLMTLAVK